MCATLRARPLVKLSRTLFMVEMRRAFNNATMERPGYLEAMVRKSMKRRTQTPGSQLQCIVPAPLLDELGPQSFFLKEDHIVIISQISG